MKYYIGYIFPQITRFIFSIYALILIGLLLFLPQTVVFTLKRDVVVLNKLHQFFLFMPFIVWGLIMIFMKEIVDIKVDKTHLRYSYSFFGLKFGSWEEIPNNSRIILDIYKSGYNSSIDTGIVKLNQVNYTNSFLYKVKLFLEDHNNQLTLAKGRNKDKLLKKTQAVAKFLEIEIEDLTEK